MKMNSRFALAATAALSVGFGMPVEDGCPEGGLDPLVLDLAGDGLDFGGKVTTTLLGGGSKTVRWTKAGSNDAFLLADATKLRAQGFDLRAADGSSISGTVLFRDGLRLKDPSGSEKVVSNGRGLAEMLDTNRDGKLNGSDSAWSALVLFKDADMDGQIDAGEMLAPSSAGVRELSVRFGESTTDGYGNTRVAGTFTRTDGTTGSAVDVTFKQIMTYPTKPPKRRLPPKRLPIAPR